MIESIKDIIGQTAEQINDKPRLEIINPDDLGIRDHFTPGTHVGGVKVQDDVDEEDDVYDGVDYQ